MIPKFSSRAIKVLATAPSATSTEYLYMCDTPAMRLTRILHEALLQAAVATVNIIIAKAGR